MFERYIPPPILQPDIWLGPLRIAEPVTSLTALLIALVCWYAWRRLGRSVPVNPVTRFIRFFFFLMMLATISGGLIGHAFLYVFSFEWKVPGWVLSMMSIAALERGAILHARPLMPAFWGRFFSVLNIVELAVFLFLALSTLNFHFVEVHAGYGLVVVTGIFEGYVWYRQRDRGSALILSAIPMATAAVAFHLAHYSPSIWFTYFDVGHIIMCVCALAMMNGVERMRFYEKQRAE